MTLCDVIQAKKKLCYYKDENVWCRKNMITWKLQIPQIVIIVFVWCALYTACIAYIPLQVKIVLDCKRQMVTVGILLFWLNDIL